MKNIIQIKIRNFKSIVELELKDVSNFSIFAGSNGVGKSNIFEAIEFSKSIIELGANGAVKKYGGYDNIHSRKMRKENARKFLFEIDIVISNHYKFRLEVNDLDGDASLKETFTINDEMIAKRDGESVTIHGQKLELSVSKEQTVLNLISKESSEFLQFIKSIQRYTIDPNLAREPDDITSDSVLDKFASNITTVLANIESKDSNSVSEIIETMQLLVPNLENIKTQKEKLINKMVATFKEEGSRDSFPARLVSDGTIYALSILAIIYSNKNGIIMIEEPERGLHPKAIGELVEFFREKSINYPIFINTHSEAIIKKALPSEVFIVSKNEGKTELFNVKQKFPDYDYTTMDINEMWLSNMFGGGLPW